MSSINDHQGNRDVLLNSPLVLVTFADGNPFSGKVRLAPEQRRALGPCLYFVTFVTFVGIWRATEILKMLCTRNFSAVRSSHLGQPTFTNCCSLKTMQISKACATCVNDEAFHLFSSAFLWKWSSFSKLTFHCCYWAHCCREWEWNAMWQFHFHNLQISSWLVIP